jgi:hypothetical protein
MSSSIERIRVTVDAVLGVDSPHHRAVCDRLAEGLCEAREQAAELAEKKHLAKLGLGDVVAALAACAKRRKAAKAAPVVVAEQPAQEGQ